MSAQKWKSYFVFSKRDKQATVFLLLLIAGALLAPEFYRAHRPQTTLEIIPLRPTPAEPNNNSAAPKKLAYNSPDKLFYFNPNTATAGEWEKLGLRPKTIAILLNYVNKGGRFYKADDIRKIYSLKPEEAERLIPYIRIPAAPQQHSYANNYTTNRYSKPAPKIIDINTATVNDFKTLPGVTHAMAYKIFNYREKIGSFFSVDELRSTYGITDSVWQMMQPYLSYQPATMSKININLASYFELVSHPQIISKDIAKAILIYREKNGPFTSVEDLKKIVFIKEPAYQKIEPYVRTE